MAVEHSIVANYYIGVEPKILNDNIAILHLITLPNLANYASVKPLRLEFEITDSKLIARIQFI